MKLVYCDINFKKWSEAKIIAVVFDSLVIYPVSNQQVESE